MQYQRVAKRLKKAPYPWRLALNYLTPETLVHYRLKHKNRNPLMLNKNGVICPTLRVFSSFGRGVLVSLLSKYAAQRNAVRIA